MKSFHYFDMGMSYGWGLVNNFQIRKVSRFFLFGYEIHLHLYGEAEHWVVYMLRITSHWRGVDGEEQKAKHLPRPDNKDDDVMLFCRRILLPSSLPLDISMIWCSSHKGRTFFQCYNGRFSKNTRGGPGFFFHRLKVKFSFQASF